MRKRKSDPRATRPAKPAKAVGHTLLEKVEALCRDRGWTDSELLTRMQYRDHTYITKIRRGRLTRGANIVFLEALANLTGLPVEYWRDDTERFPPRGVYRLNPKAMAESLYGLNQSELERIAALLSDLRRAKSRLREAAGPEHGPRPGS